MIWWHGEEFNLLALVIKSQNCSWMTIEPSLVKLTFLRPLMYVENEFVFLVCLKLLLLLFFFNLVHSLCTDTTKKKLEVRPAIIILCIRYMHLLFYRV